MKKIEGIAFLTVEFARTNFGNRTTLHKFSNMTEALLFTIQQIDLYEQTNQTRLNVIKLGIEKLSVFNDDEATLLLFQEMNPGYDLSTVIQTEAVLTYVPRWPLLIMVVSVIICFGLSAMYHLFQFHSLYVCTCLSTLDFGGICISLMGNTYPTIYYPFACAAVHPQRNLFMWATTISGTFAFCALLTKKLSSSEYNGVRLIMFLFIGIIVTSPNIYLSSLQDEDNTSYFRWRPYLIGGIGYIGGAIVYVLKVPEKFFPYKFDIIGSSHQIFHVGVVVGAYIHFNAALEIY